MVVVPIRPDPDDLFAAQHLTEAGNADRLIDLHGDDLIYVPELDTWHVWNEQRWVPDQDGEVYRCARATIQQLQRFAVETSDQDRRKELLRHAMRSESDRAIKALVNIAQYDRRVITPVDQLDRDPRLLCCANGELDLVTLELHQARRESLCTRLAPVSFDPHAESPIWDKFTKRIFGGHPGLGAYVQRAAGASIVGGNTDQVVFVGWGTGANGKSTKRDALANALGDYAVAIDAELLLAGERRSSGPRPELLRLRKARFVTAIESGDERRLNENLVKSLTGGDPITAPALHSNTIVSFKPDFSLWLLTNHRPIVRDQSEAIWRRLRLVPFTTTIPVEERDPRLADRLLDEAPGVLLWAALGARDWHRDGLGTAQAVSDATAAYKHEQDHVGGFLEDCCIVDSAAVTPSGPLYTAYGEWCQANGEHTWTSTAFGRALGDRGHDAIKTSKGQRARRGLRLKGSLV